MARNTTDTTQILAFAANHQAAVQAVLAIHRGDAPSPEGYRAAQRCGLADYNLHRGYSLHPLGREIVAALG